MGAAVTIYERLTTNPRLPTSQERALHVDTMLQRFEYIFDTDEVTVAGLKRRLQEEEGIPIARQVIITNEQELQDVELLKNYWGQRLIVLLRLQGPRVDN